MTSIICLCATLTFAAGPETSKATRLQADKIGFSMQAFQMPHYAMPGYAMPSNDKDTKRRASAPFQMPSYEIPQYKVPVNQNSTYFSLEAMKKRDRDARLGRVEGLEFTNRGRQVKATVSSMRSANSYCTRVTGSSGIMPVVPYGMQVRQAAILAKKASESSENQPKASPASATQVSTGNATNRPVRLRPRVYTWPASVPDSTSWARQRSSAMPTKSPGSRPRASQGWTVSEADQGGRYLPRSSKK